MQFNIYEYNERKHNIDDEQEFTIYILHDKK